MTATADTARLMDAIYANQRHVYDLTRKYYLLGRDHLISRLAPSEGGTVLELGCGTGRNLIAAARKHPDAVYYGVDISERMLETAAENVRKAGLDAQIRLRQGDAADPSIVNGFGVEAFDRVFYSYTLSMMPIWRQALDTGFARLAAGGRVHIVDFGQQDRLPGAFKRLLFAWLAKFHVSPRADLPAVLEDQARRSAMTLNMKDLYRGYAVYAELEAHSPATK